jgi:AraC family transcriptional regulator
VPPEALLAAPRQLFEAAARLPDARLDEGFVVSPGVEHDFPQERPSVRDMLERLVHSKEVWTAAIAGREAPAGGERSLEGLRQLTWSAHRRWIAIGALGHWAPRSPPATRSSGSRGAA